MNLMSNKFISMVPISIFSQKKKKKNTNLKDLNARYTY